MKFKIAFMLILVSFMSGFGLVACNSGGGGDGGTAPTAPVVNPSVPCYYGTCPTDYNNGYGQTINFYAMKDVYASYYGYGQTNPTTLTVNSNFGNILKNLMGVCDRMDNSGGIYSCTAWQNGSHQIVVTATNSLANEAVLMIKSYPSSSSSFYYYGYQFPDAKEFFLNLFGFQTVGAIQGYYNPLVLGGKLWPTDQGFELRIDSGPTFSKGGTLQLFTAGKLEDSAFNVELYYQGSKAASGRMIRY